jgi:hypothetical protein
MIACGSSSTITISEKTDIYSAVIRQLYTVNRNYEEYFNFPTLYMVQTTDDKAGGRHTTEPNSVLLKEYVKLGIMANIDDFSADIVWVKEFSDVSWEGGRVEGGGAIITLGNINLQQDGSAQVAISISFGSTGAFGLTYFVEHIQGIWQVVGDIGMVWVA